MDGPTGLVQLKVDVVSGLRHQHAAKPGAPGCRPTHAGARSLDQEPERPFELVGEQFRRAGPVLGPPLRHPDGLLLRAPTDAQVHGLLGAGR